MKIVYFYYREQKRLSVQDVQGSRSLSEENDNDDEHDPKYDYDSKAEPADHSDSEDLLTFLRGTQARSGRMVIALLS